MTSHAPDEKQSPEQATLERGLRPRDSIASNRARQAEERLTRVGSHQPFLLDEPDSVWLVYAGKVDVFAVEMQDGQPVGIRRHVLRAEAGQAIFGMDVGTSGIRLLASGVAGAQVLKLEQARLRELAQDPAHTADVIPLLDHWVSGLSFGIAQSLSPREHAILEPGQELAVERGVAMPQKGHVWVKHLAGDSCFMSRRELRLSSADGFLPVSTRTWLQSVGASTLQVVDTTTLIRQDPTWSSLKRFHRLVLDCIVSNLKQTRRAEVKRLKDKAELDQRVVGNALSRLASVLEPPRDLVKTPSLSTFVGEERGESLFGLVPDDALLVACRWVGRALGLTIQLQPGAKDWKSKDPLSDIARASRIRTRRVALRGEWWRNDNGPLLAYTEETKHPVALLPMSAGYELLDSVEQTRLPVTEKVASILAPFAYTFCRPFPERMLTAWDLIKFGLHGCQNDLVTIAFMGVAGGLLGTLIPLATGALFDSVIPGAVRGTLFQLSLALIVSALAAALFQLTRGIASLRLEGRLGVSIQAALWDRLLSLPVPFFRDYTAGDLTERAMGIDAIRQVLSSTTILSILASVFSVFNFGLLFVYDPRLAWMATGLVVVAIGAAGLVSYLQMRHQRLLTQMEGHITGLILEFITGISKLRVAGAEGRAFGFWAREYSAQRKLAYETRSLANSLIVFNATYPILTSMVIFATLVAYGAATLSTGKFLAFNAAFSQFLFAGLQMTAAVVSVLSVVPMYERVKPILQTLPEVDQVKSDPGELTGEIQINHVNFRYRTGGPLVLQDVSLNVEAGEFVALVGPSGSGKSTLLRLLLGFDAPESGAIYYDGQDLHGLDIRAVRRQLGVVLQNGKLMPGDILTNIVGTSTLTLEDAWEAARMAGLDKEIEQMPMGMHTVIGEGGSTLSGGQRQRLLIARAIVTKPRVLFFDEATSALDSATQAVVGASLERLQATRVVIAHRLSTIVKADRIFVLEAGRLVQSGTYAELMDQPGLFADLVKRQLA